MEKETSSFEYCSGLKFVRTRIGGRWSIQQWAANSFENCYEIPKSQETMWKAWHNFEKKIEKRKERLERARWNEIWREWSGWRWGVDQYRFSAFWLRSKCSICSYQLNIWYGPHCGSRILNWFLNRGGALSACTASSEGRPGIAVPPGMAHHPLGGKTNKHDFKKMLRIH